MKLLEIVNLHASLTCMSWYLWYSPAHDTQYFKIWYIEKLLAKTKYLNINIISVTLPLGLASIILFTAAVPYLLELDKWTPWSVCTHCPALWWRRHLPLPVLQQVWWQLYNASWNQHQSLWVWNNVSFMTYIYYLWHYLWHFWQAISNNLSYFWRTSIRL